MVGSKMIDLRQIFSHLQSQNILLFSASWTCWFLVFARHPGWPQLEQRCTRWAWPKYGCTRLSAEIISHEAGRAVQGWQRGAPVTCSVARCGPCLPGFVCGLGSSVREGTRQISSGLTWASSDREPPRWFKSSISVFCSSLPSAVWGRVYKRRKKTALRDYLLFFTFHTLVLWSVGAYVDFVYEKGV